jgi:hypothetical protein
MEKVYRVVLFTLAFLAFSYIGYRTGMNYADSVPVYDTVRVTVYDTITYRKPVAVDSVVVRYVTAKIPVASVQDSVIRPEEPQDSAEVAVPITQKVYRDTAYTAWVSGYMPSLDSISIRQSTHYVTETVPTRRKRWGVGVHAGYGVTAERNPRFAPYIGIGITYNLFNF